MGADLTRGDLAARGVDLARMLRALLPGDAEVAGLLALVLLRRRHSQPGSTAPAGWC